jgi:hypothetical protein
MKRKRSTMIAIITVVLTICTAILLSGCASTGGGKGAGRKQESALQNDQKTALKETGASSSEVQKKPVAYKGASGKTARTQAASLNIAKDRLKHYVTSLKQGLERLLPGTLREIKWNGIIAVLAGIVVISMIYGLAFGLGRLPARRRGAGRPAGGRQFGEQAGAPVSH